MPSSSVVVPGVLGLIDHSHTTTELFHDAVMRNGEANERIGAWHQ